MNSALSLPSPQMLMLHCATVFNKCADTMEEGTRLANMSWRIWNRETLCCDTQPQYMDSANLPPLSTSVDSVCSVSSTKPDQCRSQRKSRLSFETLSVSGPLLSSSLTRGRDKHITSQGLQRMVHSIQEKQALEPLSPSIADAVPSLPPSLEATPKPQSPQIHPCFDSSPSASTASTNSPDSQRSANRTDESFTSAELHASHSVQRGFSPGKPSSIKTGSTHLTPAPISTRSVSHPKPHDGKKHPAFIVGGSSGEDESSYEDPKSHNSKQGFLSKNLKPALTGKKQTSFKDEVESRMMAQKSALNENVFEDSDEESTSPDSAIEDEEEDDGSDWEDDGSELAEAAHEEKPVFKRVDSKPTLVSRRSLLTSQLATESERAAEFARLASNSTPALHRTRTCGSSGLKLEVSHDDEPGHAFVLHPPREGRPMVRTSSTLATLHPPALSPRSTRRNMLAQELTETLRKDLLHERQQQGVGRRTNIKRSHTSAELSRTAPPEMDLNKGLFGGYGIGDYHATGW